MALARVSDASMSALVTIKHIKVREGGEQFLAEKLKQVDLSRWSASRRVTVALNTESSAFALRALKTSRWGNVFGRSTSNEVTAKELLDLLEKFSDDQSVVSHILANRGQGSFWSFNWLMPAGRNFWKVIRDDEKAMDRLLDLAALHPTINKAALENGEIDWYLKKSIVQFLQAFETARRDKNQAMMQSMLKRPAFRFLMDVEENALSPAWIVKYNQVDFLNILNQAGLDPVLLCQKNNDYSYLMPILEGFISSIESNSIEIPEGTELSPQLIELFGAEEEVYAASLEDTNSILSKIQEGSRTRLRAQYFRSAAPEEVAGGGGELMPSSLSDGYLSDGSISRTPSPLANKGDGTDGTIIAGASGFFASRGAAVAVEEDDFDARSTNLYPQTRVAPVGGPDRRP